MRSSEVSLYLALLQQQIRQRPSRTRRQTLLFRVRCSIFLTKRWHVYKTHRSKLLRCKQFFGLILEATNAVNQLALLHEQHPNFQLRH